MRCVALLVTIFLIQDLQGTVIYQLTDMHSGYIGGSYKHISQVACMLKCTQNSSCCGFSFTLTGNSVCRTFVGCANSTGFTDLSAPYYLKIDVRTTEQALISDTTISLDDISSSESSSVTTDTPTEATTTPDVTITTPPLPICNLKDSIPNLIRSSDDVNLFTDARNEMKIVELNSESSSSYCTYTAKCTKGSILEVNAKHRYNGDTINITGHTGNFSMGQELVNSLECVEPQCNDGWILGKTTTGETKSLCYKLVTECPAGSVAAPIFNEEQNQALKDSISALQLNHETSQYFAFFIGLRNVPVNGVNHFIWEYDNSSLTSFVKWDSGQPSRAWEEEFGFEDCVGVWFNNYYKWNDLHCSRKHENFRGIVCAMDAH